MPWLEQANLILRRAHADAYALAALAQDSSVIDAIIGFHAQQSVEKGLKAVLAANGIAYPRTHRIEILQELLADNRIAMPTTVESALILSPYGAHFRYDDPPEDGLDRAGAVRLVTVVLAWCDTQVAGASDDA